MPYTNGMFERIMRLVREPRTQAFPGGVVTLPPDDWDAEILRTHIKEVWDEHLQGERDQGKEIGYTRNMLPEWSTLWAGYLWSKGDVQADCWRLREYTEADLHALADTWLQLTEAVLEATEEKEQALGPAAAILLGNIESYMHAARRDDENSHNVRSLLGWEQGALVDPDPSPSMRRVMGRLDEWARAASAEEIGEVLEECAKSRSLIELASVGDRVLEVSQGVWQKRHAKIVAGLLANSRNEAGIFRNPAWSEEVFQNVADIHAKALEECVSGMRKSADPETMAETWTRGWSRELYREAFKRNWHIRSETAGIFKRCVIGSHKESAPLFGLLSVVEDLVSDKDARNALVTAEPDKISQLMSLATTTEAMKGPLWAETVKQIVAEDDKRLFLGHLRRSDENNVRGLGVEDLLFLVENDNEAYRVQGHRLIMLLVQQDNPAVDGKPVKQSR